MAKWIKSGLQNVSNLLRPSFVPHTSRAKPCVPQVCSSTARFSHNSWLQHSLQLLRKQKVGNEEKKVAKAIWNDRIPSLTFRPGFGNLGRLKLFQSLSSRNARTPKLNVRFSYNEPWMMSDEEVVSRIREHECVGVVKLGVVSKYESNQLASNEPIEDRRFVTRLLHDKDCLVFGVLDGHGGDSCAQNVSQRLSDYIATALLPNEILLGSAVKNYLFAKHQMVSNNADQYNFREDPVSYENLKEYFAELCRVQKRLHGGHSRTPTLTHLQESHGFHAAVTEAKEEQVVYTMTALSKAFLRLDADLSKEALGEGDKTDVDENKVKSAISGACALVVYLKGLELTIANCGDCRAVLGVQNDDGLWSALQLSNDHTAGK